MGHNTASIVENLADMPPIVYHTLHQAKIRTPAMQCYAQGLLFERRNITNKYIQNFSIKKRTSPATRAIVTT